MKLEDAYETVSEWPYNFSSDVSNPINDETLAMYWIKKHKTLPPKELLHEPSIKDADGCTCAMHWIVNVGGNPPQEIRHDPSLQNRELKTCAMLWIEHVKTLPPPELMRCFGNVVLR